jgi:hypothetical protein
VTTTRLDPATAAAQASRFAFHAGVPTEWQTVRADLKGGNWDSWAAELNRALRNGSPRTVRRLVKLAEGAGYDKPPERSDHA